MKRFLDREPVVIVTTVFGALAAVHEAIVSNVTVEDGWKAVGLVALTALIRHLVTPTAAPRL